MKSVKEQLDFFENIFNDDSLCSLTLAALTSKEELEGNRKNQESALEISKLILENIDNIKFNNPNRKKFVKEYFEMVPEIVAKFNIKFN